MDIQIESLSLGLTYECTMACADCLRGDCPKSMQKKKMPDRWYPLLFGGLMGVDSLTLTGGEPFLNIKGINLAREAAAGNEVPVSNVFIATNGTIIGKDVWEAIYGWYRYTLLGSSGDSGLARPGMHWLKEDIECSMSVAVSLDRFHRQIPLENYLFFRQFSFYSNAKENEGQTRIIPTGRASDIGFQTLYAVDDGWRPNETPYMYESGDDTITFGEIYVSPRGYILPECDTSYSDEKGRAFARMDGRRTLKQILEEYAVEHAAEVE